MEQNFSINLASVLKNKKANMNKEFMPSFKGTERYDIFAVIMRANFTYGNFPGQMQPYPKNRIAKFLKGLYSVAAITKD